MLYSLVRCVLKRAITSTAKWLSRPVSSVFYDIRDVSFMAVNEIRLFYDTQ